MIYALLGFSVIALGVGVWLAVWIGRLKDQVLAGQATLSARTGQWNQERQAVLLARAEAGQLKAQLVMLEADHVAVLKKVEDGSLCTPEGIAAALRHGPG